MRWLVLLGLLSTLACDEAPATAVAAGVDANLEDGDGCRF